MMADWRMITVENTVATSRSAIPTSIEARSMKSVSLFAALIVAASKHSETTTSAMRAMTMTVLACVHLLTTAKAPTRGDLAQMVDMPVWTALTDSQPVATEYVYSGGPSLGVPRDCVKALRFSRRSILSLMRGRCRLRSPSTTQSALMYADVHE